MRVFRTEKRRGAAAAHRYEVVMPNVYVRRTSACALAAGLLLLASPSISSAADLSVCGGAGALKPAPLNRTVERVDGGKLELSSLRGKVVLLNFWATWCGPCRTEMPEFADLYRRYQSEGLEIVGLSMDSDASAIKEFVAELQIPYPIGFSDDGLEDAFQLFGLPTTIVIARDGRVCRRNIGLVPKATFETQIRKLL
jgi:thiol-disulfide isomerase/thioredoxin